MVEMFDHDEAAAGCPLPPWLEPDDPEHIPPAALQPLYQELPLEVTHALEDARRMIRDGYKQGVLAAHAALAEQERVTFKDWCLAVGIHPKTANSIVRRHEAAERDANESRPPAEPPNPPIDADEVEPKPEPEPDDDPSPEPSPKPKDKDQPKPKPQPPKPEPKPKQPRLVFEFDTAEEQQRVSASIERVMKGRKLQTREEALLHILDIYDTAWMEADAEGEIA